MKLRMAAAFTAALAVISGFAAGGSAAPASPHPRMMALCTKSYDPYSKPLPVLRACGDIILTLRRVVRLAGGGTAYDYGAYTLPVPPLHFNALKAPDWQLREYGLPTRHVLGSRWFALMRQVRGFAKPPPYLIEVPRLRAVAGRSLYGSATSLGWAGYLVTGHNYNYVNASWYEPDFIGDTCGPTSFSQWAGIGGNNTGDLGQDGTAFGESGIGNHQGWIETIENYDGSPPVALDIMATPDQIFTATTIWDPASSRFDYTLIGANGIPVTAVSRPVSADLSTAEVITERPSILGTNPVQYTALSNFQQFQVRSPAAGWGSPTGTSLFSNLPGNDVIAVTMKDRNGRDLAVPGNLTGNYSIYYKNCN